MRDPGICFSISHTRGAVAAVVGSSGPVGIDIEAYPDLSVIDAVGPSLHWNEQLALDGAAGKAAAFAQIWTRKEALLKAKGTGLCEPISVDDVTRTLADWYAHDLPAPEGFAAAVVVRA